MLLCFARCVWPCIIVARLRQLVHGLSLFVDEENNFRLTRRRLCEIVCKFLRKLHLIHTKQMNSTNLADASKCHHECWLEMTASSRMDPCRLRIQQVMDLDQDKNYFFVKKTKRNYKTQTKWPTQKQCRIVIQKSTKTQMACCYVCSPL